MDPLPAPPSPWGDAVVPLLHAAGSNGGDGTRSEGLMAPSRLSPKQKSLLLKMRRFCEHRLGQPRIEWRSACACMHAWRLRTELVRVACWAACRGASVGLWCDNRSITTAAIRASHGHGHAPPPPPTPRHGCRGAQVRGRRGPCGGSAPARRSWRDGAGSGRAGRSSRTRPACRRRQRAPSRRHTCLQS
jgi:hypothetical protein